MRGDLQSPLRWTCKSTARLADELALKRFVCHLPPGTRKWNKIEHRLFSFITQNGRGKPLVSHQAIVNLIAQRPAPDWLSRLRSIRTIMKPRPQPVMRNCRNSK
jgi:hypothetical protein